MSLGRCPGQNTQFWGADDIFDVPCPGCGKGIEFFKDDAQRKCKKCGKAVFNPRMDFGCANWCPMAEECLGQEKYDSLKEIAQAEIQRRADLEALLAGIKPEDEAVKKMFKQLYLQNRGSKLLFDDKQLYMVAKEDPKLFRKATEYYTRFIKTKDKAS
jgi:endogenous inhibitor of DNA gyrase (YacG/DUF329 family)